jgi:hypothetical protein
MTVAERADEPARVGAVRHDRRRVAVLERAESDQRGRPGRADVRAVLVGIQDERRLELRGEGREGASCVGALLERARVVAEEGVDLAATGEALHGRPLTRGGTVPVATGVTRPDGKTRRRRRDSASGRAGSVSRPPDGACERPGVVVVSVHEQKLEPGPAKLGLGGAEEAAPFRVTRQVAEVAQREGASQRS